MTSSGVSDWAVTALAPLVADPVDPGVSVRQMDDTTAQGVTMYIRPPGGSTNMTLEVWVRAQVANVGATTVKMLFHERELLDDSPWTAWSSSVALDDIAIPIGSILSQKVSTTKTLAAWGLTAGELHQIQLSRTSVGDTLIDNALLHVAIPEFS